ncbi:MAG TPA: ATP-binding protein [Kofleriaceae bacterium]|jgi:signal transduction histidine kinase
MSAVVELDTRSRHPFGDRLSIGRGAQNDLVLDDPMVSEKHAELARRGDGSIVIRDLGSRHGTFVGAKKVSEAVLHDGDEMLIGPVRLRVETASEAAPHELRTLRALFELSRAIGAEHDLQRIVDRVLDTCFQLLAADRGMIVTFLPGAKTPMATIARTRSGESLRDALSTSVMSQVLATHEPYLRTEVATDRELQRAESLTASGVRSVIAVPLRYDTAGEWLGVIQLDSTAVSNTFGRGDLEVLQVIATQAALAIKNAMLVHQMRSVRSADWERLARVVANLPVGVVVLDDRQRCVLANDWVSRRTDLLGGITPGDHVEQLAGLPVDRLVGVRELREQVTLGSPEKTLIVAAHGSPDEGETVVVISDISVERDRQAQAAHQERLALVGQLAGGIAHDFNNLLMVITSFASMIEEAAPGAVRDDARGIVDAARSATDLVRQLVTFSRSEPVKPVVVDVARELRATEKLLQRAVGPGVALTMTGCDVPACVMIARSQLEQVVMNLAVNARDAMNGAGRIDIVVASTADRVTVAVTDTGSGMPPDVAARVFEPYFTTKMRGKGSGLGLATVHGIIEQAYGAIEVRSQIGVGTTFTISLPRCEPAAALIHTGPVPSVTRGRALVIDDDESVRAVTERMLRRSGFDVVSAGDAIAGLEVIRRRDEGIDLVVSDVVMPGMSGRDLARTLENERPELKVLLVSGFTQVPLAGCHFLAKPFDRQTLMSALDRMMST